MSEPTPRWMQCVFHALQIEEYIAGHHVSFRRSWLRDWQARDLVHDSLLSAHLCRAVGIEADGGDLIRKVAVAFVDLMSGSEGSSWPDGSLSYSPHLGCD
jgi:hypothetical protein